MAPKTKAAEPLASSQQEDVSMMDASEAGSEPVTGGKEKGDPHNPSTAIQNEQRISVLSGSTATAASYQFQDEDHTLGNALRYIIMKNPDVEFCGYSIPHPSEALLNIRIQTYEGTAIAALEKGLNDLEDLCGVVADKFSEAREDFAKTNGQA